MNAAHLHLVVNHAPVLAFLFALPLLAYAAVRRDDGTWRSAVFLLVLGGAGALVAWRSGEPAEEFLEDRLQISEARVEEHEERAEIATVIAVAGAVLAPLAYWRRRRHERLAIGATLAVALAGAGAMVWTANAGGAIRHPEELDIGSPRRGEEGATRLEGSDGAGSERASRK
ncbi:MAG: hypothetical protein Q8P41_20800 [Pseudomonadota bacterium]|nr:hypothetical protein [Pseudomonadota bacterium]